MFVIVSQTVDWWDQQQNHDVPTPGVNLAVRFVLFAHGMRVLGCLSANLSLCDHLERKNQEHEVLFQRIPWLNDPQAAWLLLLMCASPRANFWLRARLDLTDTFADHHDDNVWDLHAHNFGDTSSSRFGEE